MSFVSSVSFVVMVLVSARAQTPSPDWKTIGDEAVRLLQSYVRIDTSNPPGDTRKSADFLASLLEADGIPVTRYESAPGKAIVYGRLKATMSPPAGKAILLLNHMDVVPADRTEWKMDPFAALIRGGDLWGRGALDMKALGIAEFLAFRQLKRDRVPLARDVIFLANPDEEVGGLMGSRWMIANHFAELDPEYVLDEGGFGSRDLFAPGKLVYGISVAEKKLMWLRVRAEGVAGHGSQPNAENANDRLLRALGRLLAEPQSTAAGLDRNLPVAGLLDTMHARIGTFADNKFTNAVQHSTIAVTTIRSGVGDPPKVNVIPSVAEATLDCRVLPGTTRDQWIAEVRRRLGDPGLKIEVINEGETPTVSSTDTPFYRALESAITRRHPEAIVTPMLIPYGTDSNRFRPKGVKSYGMFPGILPAEVVASMHSDGERVPLEAVREAVQILFEALRDGAAH